MDMYRDKDGNPVIHHRFGNTPTHMTEQLIQQYGDPNEINTEGLHRYNIASLIEELKTREDVEELNVAANQDYEVNTFARTIQEEGPATILVIYNK